MQINRGQKQTENYAVHFQNLDIVVNCSTFLIEKTRSCIFHFFSSIFTIFGLKVGVFRLKNLINATNHDMMYDNNLHFHARKRGYLFGDAMIGGFSQAN